MFDVLFHELFNTTIITFIIRHNTWPYCINLFTCLAQTRRLRAANQTISHSLLHWPWPVAGPTLKPTKQPFRRICEMFFSGQNNDFIHKFRIRPQVGLYPQHGTVEPRTADKFLFISLPDFTLSSPSSCPLCSFHQAWVRATGALGFISTCEKYSITWITN